MIPKIIHYCWFGPNEISQAVKTRLDGWQQILKDYELIKWDETNFDLSTAPQYVLDAYRNQKYAFVSDYVRIYALNQMGGIYLDTDVEIIKPFDDLLNQDFFIGFESLKCLSTAVIASKKNHELLLEILNLYQSLKFIKANQQFDLMPNSRRLYLYMHQQYQLKFKKEIQTINNQITIYPVQYFSPKNYYTLKTKITNQTYTVHLFDGNWKKRKLKDKMISLWVRLLGERSYLWLKGLIKKD